MASLLQIRNVPDEARRALKARAAARGESLNAYLLGLISREVARPTVAEALSRAAHRAERADASAVDVIAAVRAEREDAATGAPGNVIVVDSAAVVDALAAVSGTDDLRTYLSAEELHAPTLLDYDVLSALRGLTFAGHLTAARAPEVLTDFNDLPIRRWPSADVLRRRAFQLRDNISAYDAAYIALAEALDCPLVTRDRRLARAGGHTAQVDVR